MLHGRWSVAPVARWPQQARATVPWVTPQLLAHAQPVQLARVFNGGPPPHGMAQHDSPAPPRRARPTRRVPRRPQAVRWSWHCCAPPRGARCRQRGESVARVVLAEAARVSRWAAQLRPAAPGRRVASRTDRRPVRSSWHCYAPGGRARARLLARPVVRVVLAETARVRPKAEPRPCNRPRRRVAGLHERVRA